jgi:hypothetical protein
MRLLAVRVNMLCTVLLAMVVVITVALNQHVSAILIARLVMYALSLLVVRQGKSRINNAAQVRAAGKTLRHAISILQAILMEME